MSQQMFDIIWYFISTYDLVLPLSICACMAGLVGLALVAFIFPSMLSSSISQEEEC